jgi:predicted nucleic acid-binding protein
VVVADTGAVLALLDRNDAHHRAMRDVYDADPDGWLLPWAILPEVDYLVGKELGEPARRVWLADLESGAFAVEWGAARDLAAARMLDDRYPSLRLGLVDAVVMAIAERIRADIATVDLRHFGAVTLAHGPRLFPRDGAPLHRPRPGRPRRG